MFTSINTLPYGDSKKVDAEIRNKNISGDKLLFFGAKMYRGRIQILC